MEHRRVIIVACIVLSFLTIVHGLKCVQCGYKLPTALELKALQDSAESKVALAKRLAELQYKALNDPGCPASLPEATQCAATENFCVKATTGGKSHRYCYNVGITVCVNNECSYACESDGCNSAEPVASKGKVLLIIMVTLSLMLLFEF